MISGEGETVPMLKKISPSAANVIVQHQQYDNHMNEMTTYNL